MIFFNGIKHKNYFEGWFFKISADNFNMAFIPSVSVNKGDKKAYIQINLNDKAIKLEYDFKDFIANDNEVVIGGNKFSAEGIYFKNDDLFVNIKFGEFLKPQKDIMGCFKFGTPCKHKLISMKHLVTGKIDLNGKETVITNATGYLEKDWGTSFPTAYCWLQCNNFKNENLSFFLSVAKIGFPFLGLICSLFNKDKELRFATYNFSKIKKLSRGEIILKKGKHILKINFIEGLSNELLAPKRGSMQNKIKENLNGTIKICLYDKEKLILEDTGTNAGIEWVNF